MATMAHGIVMAAALLAALPLPASGTDGDMEPAQKLAGRIHSATEQAMRYGECVGGVVLVEHHGRVVHRRAFGLADATSDPPTSATLDTVYDLASLTKPLATGLCIAHLADRGLLSFGDKVARHLPQWRPSGEAARPSDAVARGAAWKGEITIRHLLLHTSGLPPFVRFHQLDAAKNVAEDWRLEFALQTIAGIPLRSAPGENFTYSDLGFILLGEIVRRASGLGVDEYFNQHIARPLGLKSTGFDGRSFCDRVAPTERVRDAWNAQAGQTLLRGVVHDSNARWIGKAVGHAGLFSTADDLATLARQFHRGVDNPGAGPRLLSPAIQGLILQPHVVGPTDAQHPMMRTLAWDYQTTFSSPKGDMLQDGVCHTGYTGTSILINPAERLTVIILTNRVHPDGNGDAAPLRMAVANAVALYNFGKPD